MRKILILMTTLFGAHVFADSFTSKYCEFLLPNGWSCDMEGSEWVCQSVNEDRKKEAIIILAAKLRGEQDDIAGYQSYLQQPKSFKLPGGKTQISDPISTKLLKIPTQNHIWVDSVHLASEVPGFYTRYLATVKGELGVAVTFSVAKDHYDSYKPIFDKIVETLKVFGQKQVLPSDYKLAGGKNESIPGAEGDFIDDDHNRHDIGVNKQGKSASGTSTTDMLMYLLGGLAVAGFIIMKNKKGKGKKAKKTKKK